MYLKGLIVSSKNYHLVWSCLPSYLLKNHLFIQRVFMGQNSMLGTVLGPEM